MERKWNIITSAQGAIAVENVVLNDAWMGENSLTVTVENPEPIDFTIGDYIVYRGERYVIEYDPSIIKSSEKQEFGKGFTYKDIKFRHEGQAKIVRCDFADIVLYDNERHYTSLGTFPFHCEGVDDLLDRIQANLDTLYAGQFVIIGLNTARNTTRAEASYQAAGGRRDFYTSRMEAAYAKYVDPNMEPNTDAYGKQDVFETVENIKCWDALLKVHDDFELDFIVRDETFEFLGDTYSYTAIIVGTTGSLTSKNFTYGKGNGLYEIERIGDSEQEVVTRLKAYGNTTNLPTRYYSMLSKYGFAHIQTIGSATDTELAVITDLPYRTGMFSKKVKFTVDQEVQEEQSDGRGGTSYISHTVTYTRFYFIVTLTDGTTTVNARVGLTNYDDSASTANCIITVLSEENTAADYTAFANAMRLGNTLTFVTGTKTPLFPPAFLGTLEGATSLPEAMAVFNLMLPGFPSQSLYDWVQTNRPGLITEGFGFSTDKMKPYIDAPNLSTYGEPRPASLIFDGSSTIDNIYPTIKEMEYGDTRIDEVASDVVIEDSGVYDTDTPPNFIIVLPDLGFDLEDYYKDGAAIEMTSGMCVGRKFEMASVPTQNEDGTWSCPCVREYDSTLHLWFPYASFSIASGDTYVFTGIDLPDTYIAMASERLFDAAIEQLRELCEPQTTWQPRIDDIWMANNQESADDDQTHTTVAQHDTLHSGDLFLFMDVDLGAYEGDSENPSPIAIAIEHLTINENANNGIATYDITLRNEKSESGLQRIQHQVNTIVSGNGGGVASSGANLSQLLGLISSEGKKYVLRAGDTLDGHFSFKGGVEVSTEGEGNALDVTGTTKTDDLIVEGDVVGNLNVDGDLSATGDANIAGDSTVGGDQTIEGGLNIGTDETQLNQLGAWVDDEGNANFKSITAREFMATPVFRFNKITLVEGETWNTNAYGTLKNVVPSGNIGTAEIELEPKDIASIVAGDICRGIFNALDGMTQDAITKYETATGETLNEDFSNYNYEWQASDDTDRQARDIDDSGFPLRPFFFTSYFTITHVSVSEIGYCRFTYMVRSGYPHPCDGMKFAQYGNASDTSRQSAQYTTISPHYYEIVLDGIDSYEYNSSNIMVAIGWLEGIIVKVWQRDSLDRRTGEVVDQRLEGVGFYTRQNIYFGSAIKQIDPAEVEDLSGDISNYHAYLTNPADTITVDDAGNIYNGLWVEETDEVTGETYRSYRLHSAILVNKNDEPLVLVDSDPSDGEYTISCVSSDCEFILNNGTISITKINNIPDGEIESDDDIDWEAMRNMREVKIEIVIDAEGKFPIALTFPVTVLHTEVPYITMTIDNHASGLSWNTKNSAYVGLPITINAGMHRNNVSLALTGLVLDITGITWSTSTDEETGVVTYTDSNANGWIYTSDLTNKQIRILAAPEMTDGVREIPVRATASYAGSSYENEILHSLSKVTDANVYDIWASQTVITQRYVFTRATSSAPLVRSVVADVNDDALSFYVSCDSMNDEHYRLTAAQMTEAGLTALYSIVTNGVESAKTAITIGYTIPASTIVGKDRIIFYLYRDYGEETEFMEDMQPVEVTAPVELPCHIGLTNDSDSMVYDENGTRIGALPATSAYLKFGETDVTELATWTVSLTRCTRDTTVALPSLTITSVTPTADAYGNLLPIYADITATYDGEEYTARFPISYITNGKHKYWIELNEEILVYDSESNIVLPTTMTVSLKQNPGDAYSSEDEATVYVKYGNSVIDDFSVSGGSYAIPAADLLGYVQDAIGGGLSSLIFSWDVNGDGTYYEEEKVSIVQNVHGTDGEYAQYIYRLSTKTPSGDNFAWTSSSSTDPGDYHWQYTWTDSGGTVHNPASDDFVPREWTDDASSVDETNRYEWCAYRVKGSDGTWGEYRAPFTFAAYGENGKDGGGIEYIFRASSTCSWAQGDTDHENPLYPTSSTYVDPSTWAANQADGYIAADSNWEADAMSTNETNKFIWVSSRKKTVASGSKTATWGVYTSPKLWTRWGDSMKLTPSLSTLTFTKDSSSNTLTPSYYDVQCGITLNGRTTYASSSSADGTTFYAYYKMSSDNDYTPYSGGLIRVNSSTTDSYIEFILSSALSYSGVTAANTIDTATVSIVKDGLDGTDGSNGVSAAYISVKGTCTDSDGNTPTPEIIIFDGTTSTSIAQTDLKPDTSADGNNRYRGFILILVNRSTLEIVESGGYKGEYYDTWGSSARMAALATAITNASSNYFVILATRDAMYWSDAIITALVGCGAASFETPTSSESRRPYAFIGYNGLAEGYALQRLGAHQDTDPASVAAYIANGLFVSAKDGESSVYYEIISNIGSATIASDASSVTVAPSLSFYKRVGESAKTAYSCYATMFTRTGTALHYQNHMTSPSTSYNGFSIAVGTSVTAVVFRIYDSATTSISADFLAELEIPILKNGDTGVRGKTGRAYYYLGEWTLDSHPDYIQSTDSFVADDYKTPMVTVTQSDGSFTAYVYVGSNVNTKKAYIATPPSSVWDSGVSDVRYLMSDAVFTKFAKLGSAIFNKDWMYSQYGAGYITAWTGRLEITSYSDYSYISGLEIPVVAGQWTSIRVTGYTYSDSLQIYVCIANSGGLGRNVMRIVGTSTTTITFDFYAENTDYVRICARGDGDSSKSSFGRITMVEVSSGQASEYQNMSPTFPNKDGIILFSCPGSRYGITVYRYFSNAIPLGTVPVQVVSGKSYTITVDAWATGGYMTLCLCNAEDNSVQVSNEITLNNTSLNRVSGTITATATCYAMLCAYMSMSSAGYVFRAAIRANDPFIPKVAVDWVTGYAQFAGGNVCFRPDGTVKFRNAMFSGYVRNLPTIFDSTNIGNAITLKNAWLKYSDFGGASYTFGGVQGGFPVSAAAQSSTPTSIIDLSKAGSTIVFKNAPDDSAIVHLPFISHHFGGNTGVMFEYFYTGASESDFSQSPRRYACYTEMMRARSYVGSTIEVYNVDSSDGGMHDVYIVGCYNPWADGTDSDVNNRVEFSDADEKSISQLHRLTYGSMVRLVCKRYSSGKMFSPWLGGGIEIVYWEVESGATGFTAEQFDEGFIQEIM